LLENDAALLKAIVLEAGALALSFLQSGFDIMRKADGSDVTSADLAVDQMLREALMKARPHYGWLSEETPDDLRRLETSHVWIADPIDGTRNFIDGKDDWCIGAGLLIDGQAAVAAIFQPRRNRFYAAIAGQGATCNEVRLRGGDSASIMGARVMTGKTEHQRLRSHGIVEVPTSDLPYLIRLAHVAEGRLDGVLSQKSKYDWDLAPGTLLVTESGSVATALDGSALRYNAVARMQAGILAAGPQRHHALQEIMGPK
jgi:myo-inositol-1(or 4)-monophosphatase